LTQDLSEKLERTKKKYTFLSTKKKRIVILFS